MKKSCDLKKLIIRQSKAVCKEILSFCYLVLSFFKMLLINHLTTGKRKFYKIRHYFYYLNKFDLCGTCNCDIYIYMTCLMHPRSIRTMMLYGRVNTVVDQPIKQNQLYKWEWYNIFFQYFKYDVILTRTYLNNY